MRILSSFKKYKSSFAIKKRFFLINVLIFSSLSFVILQNINEIRYKTIKTENDNILILDRFTSKIKAKK